MDAEEYTLDELVEWTRVIAKELEAAMAQRGAPQLDLEWLLLRCQDTLRGTGRAARVSGLQLLRDVAEFDAEFPGRLSHARPVRGGG